MSSIPANGVTQSIYLRMLGTTMQYSIGTLVSPGAWSNIPSWPVTILNNNSVSTTMLNVKVTMDLTISNTYADQTGYFIVGTRYITFNGGGYTIFINNIQNYRGFIQNGTGFNSSFDPTGAGYSNVIVQNFVTNESSPTRLSTLYVSNTSEQAGGWLCQFTFGKKAIANEIRNCVNNNPITGRYCGGIVGSLLGNGIGSSVTISNCVNNGLINTSQTGGVVGVYAGNDNGQVFINDCSNNAVINGLYAGGICGQSSAQRNGRVTLNRCANIAAITIDQAGGIVGSGGAYNNGLLTILNCTNSGTISGNFAGGITGQGVGSGGDVIVTSCTNSAVISGFRAGGIVGWQCAKDGGRVTLTSCTNQNTGNITGVGAGGITGGESATANGAVTINTCINNANISGLSAGGIIGMYGGGKEISGNGNVSINGCTNTGIISGQYAGGIAGEYAGNNGGDAAFTNCTNSGAINADSAGGIAGRYAGNNGSNVSFTNCTNTITGDISVTAQYAGGIAGPYAGNGAQSSATFKFCINGGDINGLYGGGIAGAYVGDASGNAIFEDSTNNGKILATFAGGIAGDKAGYGGSATFTRCTNTGEINANYVGGIVGWRAGYGSGGNITFTSCTNSGAIIASSAGGIAGEECGSYSGSAIFTDCSNNGVISGQYSGGIAGRYAGYNSVNVTFTGCTNSGSIDGDYGGGISGYQTAYDGNVTFTGCTNTITGDIIAQFAGGITGADVGYNDGNVTLTNCTNRAEISGKSAGGIAGQYAGYNGNATFTDCINSGDINTPNGGGIAGRSPGFTGGKTRFTGCANSGPIGIVAQHAGGIAGSTAGERGTATFISCTNSGLVGAWFSGGIAGDKSGYQGVARFEACENTGNISVNGDYGGGIAGSNAGWGSNILLDTPSSAIFIDCKNSGVISRNSAGGIAGSTTGSKIGGNATFTNCTNNGIINGLHYTGGITSIGAGSDSGNVTFTNCTNNGEIITELSGGIAGEECGKNNGNASFTGCINNGIVSAENGGGIVGQYVTRSTFTGCTNNGSINALNGGGIAGQYVKTSTFTTCINNGSISGLNAGGIVGQYALSVFTRCTNNGYINAISAGGIAGQYAGNSGSSIFNGCINNGKINSIATSAGGIAGQYAGDSGLAQFSDCTNNATIEANAAGGIVGADAAKNNTSEIIFSRCTNTGEISGQDAGGIAGKTGGYNSGKATFTKCMNTGVISGQYAGGIMGSYAGNANSNLISFDDCLNSGDVISQYAGGIVGAYAGSMNGSLTITKCYTIGSVSGQYAGGITGGKFASDTNRTSTISNCYSTGNISGDTSQTKAGGIVGAYIGYTSSAAYTPVVLISKCYSLGAIGTSCGGIVGGAAGGLAYSKKPTIDISNCYSYGVLSGNGQGIIAASLTSTFINLTISNIYIANGFWNDASANANLVGYPTNINTNNPGSTWMTLSTTFLPNVPYVLSIFNDTMYTPASATSNVNYSSGPGLFQPGYNYQIVYSNQSGNVLTTRVFSYKGISPYYYAYDNNIFTFTNTNGITIPNNVIYVAVVKSTGVLNYTLPVNNNPLVIQTPNPFTPYALSPDNIGKVTYTDLSYIIIPDISNNPTYTLATDVANNTYDIFQNSNVFPAAFIPNSLFISNNLIAPGPIVKDSFGNFYVGNTSYNVISVFDNSGNYIRPISIYSAINVPVLVISYLAIDSSNNLYAVSNSSTGVFVVPSGDSINDIDNTILKYTYGNDLRGLTCNANYLYIVKQAIPKYVIKYNLVNKTYLQIPLTLASPALPLTSQPTAIVYNMINTSPTLYLTTIEGSNNRVYSISDISGNPSLIGGIGASATITSNTIFPNNAYPYSITMDNSANLYVGLDEGNIQPVNTKSVGKIARVTPTGTISNTSYLSYNGLGIGRPEGLLFDQGLYLYATDILHNRVIKSSPNTFLFGPAVLNADAFYIKDPSNNAQYKTYLYDVTNSIITTTFNLTADCFQKGTKILCEHDIYVPIENIKVGDLVKTYKHGYQKVIRCVTRRSCDYVNSSRNQIYAYTQESNPELIEDLYLTGGHSLLVDALSETESNDMKQVDWLDTDFMVDDKYKLMCCFNKKLDVSVNQNVDLYRFALEPPENARPTHVYGIWANGILSESCSNASMDK